jgi:hypothetical protein
MSMVENHSDLSWVRISLCAWLLWETNFRDIHRYSVKAERHHGPLGD